jgi:hypothetical protein
VARAVRIGRDCPALLERTHKRAPPSSCQSMVGGGTEAKADAPGATGRSATGCSAAAAAGATAGASTGVPAAAGAATAGAVSPEVLLASVGAGSSAGAEGRGESAAASDDDSGVACSPTGSPAVGSSS